MLKIIRLIASLTFLTFCLSLAVAAQEKKTPTKYTGSMRGETFAYKYTEQDFIDTPSWKVEDGEPPISISRAMQIARANLSRFVESSETWKPWTINLRALNDDKWFYNIMFICSGANCRNLPTRQFTIIVKMDGSILEPKKVITVD